MPFVTFFCVLGKKRGANGPLSHDPPADSDSGLGLSRWGGSGGEAPWGASPCFIQNWIGMSKDSPVGWSLFQLRSCFMTKQEAER